MPTTPTRTRILPAAAAWLGALLLIGSTTVGVAAARPAEEPRGQAKKAAADTAWTEDNDTNDGGTRNNVVDDHDDKHPSGKDRSVEKGRSGNQGRASSDPDDDARGPDRSNGGPDKPNGSGGLDKADQDGNNGCGNDDDFEDDNEGWCGRNPKRANPKGEPGAKRASRPAATASHGGNGTADIQVTVTCRSVSVRSSKDISNVVISFADGTTVKFDGLHGHEWSRTFDRPVASATAKSATTRTTGTAPRGSCELPTIVAPAGQGGVVPGAGGDVRSAGAGSCPTGTMATPSGNCTIPSIMAAASGPGAIGAEVLAATAAAAGERAVSARSAGGAAVLASASAPAAPSAGELPFTGTGVTILLAVALFALGVGAALLRIGRPRTAA